MIRLNPELRASYCAFCFLLPLSLAASTNGGEFEYVKAKLLGDGFTGVPVREIRGAILRPFLENRMLAAGAAPVTFFAWGFLTEGWLIRKDFAASAALYRSSDLQMKYMPFGMAATLVALVPAVLLYAGWCGGASGAVKGLQFGLLMGVFCRMHPLDLQSCHYEYGYETRPGNRGK